MTTSSPADDDRPPVLDRTVLQADSSWNGVAYTEYPPGAARLTVVRFHVPAHTSLPWHTHPVPSAAYVVSGSFTVEERATGRRRTLVAGEAFAESVGDVHRGFTGDVAAEIVATYAGVPGVPLSVPVD